MILDIIEAKRYSNIIVYNDTKRARMLKEKLRSLDGPDTIVFVESLGNVCTPRERHNLAQVLERVGTKLSYDSRQLIRSTTTNWYTTPMLSNE